jgi:hypothetical protein
MKTSNCQLEIYLEEKKILGGLCIFIMAKDLIRMMLIRHEENIVSTRVVRRPEAAMRMQRKAKTKGSRCVRLCLQSA